MHTIYLWVIPDRIYLPPSYRRAHFDFRTRRNAIVELAGEKDGALPIQQHLRVTPGRHSTKLPQRRVPFDRAPR